MSKRFFGAAVAFICLVQGAHAGVHTYESFNKIVGGCIPFGCPDSYGPHMGFIYMNIKAFRLSPGDTIAFDTGLPNDFELSFDLSLGATGNGGVSSSEFTKVSSLGGGFFGDAIVGNFDVVFVAETRFNFPGGGLIVDFFNTNGNVSDTTREQNLVSGQSDFELGTYIYGQYPGDITFLDTDDFDKGGNFQVSFSSVPLPGTLPLALGSVALLAVFRRIRLCAR